MPTTEPLTGQPDSREGTILASAIQALTQSGFCIINNVLKDPEEIKSRLMAAARASEERGLPTRMPQLDPNDRNVRVFNLLDLDVCFRELIVNPTALHLVESLIGPDFLISNFTANIALPGSQSMPVHADQAIVIPEPWLAPWTINIIWCLDDMTRDNGGTLYLPDSQKIERIEELPEAAKSRMIPFEASAGSIIAMDGRMWHTSGENITSDQQRALLFGYYCADFIRPQSNWNAALSSETIRSLPASLVRHLGLGAAANLNQAETIFRQANPEET